MQIETNDKPTVMKNIPLEKSDFVIYISDAVMNAQTAKALITVNIRADNSISLI